MNPSAPASIVVSVEGVANTLRRFDSIKDDITEVVKKELSRAGIKTQALARMNLTASGAVDTGLLRASIRPTFPIADRGLTVHVGTTHIQYARFIEFGTGPAAGHGPYRAPPPVQALVPWVRRHLRLGAKGGVEFLYEAIAFLISRKIFHRGTPPRPFMAPAAKEATRGLGPRIARAIKAEIRRRPR